MHVYFEEKIAPNFIPIRLETTEPQQEEQDE